MWLKRFGKFIISFVFFWLSRLWNALCSAVTGTRRGTCVVLYYHAIRPEHRALFARQMDILLRSAVPISADHSEPLGSGRRYAAVTFDDGYENVLDNALPELAKRGIPSTIFAVSNALGGLPSWISDPSSALKAERISSADRLRGLGPSLVTIGSHTASHPRLTELNEEKARRELSESRSVLEAVLGREVRLFSFPHGEHNRALVEWARDAGYVRVFTIDPALAFSSSREFVTGRVSVEATDWPFEFRLKLLGAYSWLPWASSLKRKLLWRTDKPVASRGHLAEGNGRTLAEGASPLGKQN